MISFHCSRPATWTLSCASRNGSVAWRRNWRNPATATPPPPHRTSMTFSNRPPHTPTTTTITMSSLATKGAAEAVTFPLPCPTYRWERWRPSRTMTSSSDRLFGRISPLVYKISIPKTPTCWRGSPPRRVQAAMLKWRRSTIWRRWAVVREGRPHRHPYYRPWKSKLRR